MDKQTSYVILPEYKLVVCNYQGKITLKEVINLTKEFISEPSFNPEFDVLLDFRDALVVGFRMDVSDYVEFLKETNIIKVKVKLGVLYGTTNQKFLFTFYKSLSRLINLDIDIFKNIRQYFEWMNFDESATELIEHELIAMKSASGD